jgi:hypothetical protein
MAISMVSYKFRYLDVSEAIPIELTHVESPVPLADLLIPTFKCGSYTQLLISDEVTQSFDDDIRLWLQRDHLLLRCAHLRPLLSLAGLLSIGEGLLLASACPSEERSLLLIMGLGVR